MSGSYNQEGYYLSPKGMARARSRKSIMTVAGGILTVFFAAGVLMAAMDYSGLRSNLPVYVILLVPSALLFYRGLRTGILARQANRYNSIFECDQDGVVTIHELTAQTGKTAPAVLSEVEQLLEKGYLCNCSLQRNGQPCVILSAGTTDEAGSAFVNVVCEKCGATTRIRAGSSGRCEYCGSALNSK